MLATLTPSHTVVKDALPALVVPDGASSCTYYSPGRSPASCAFARVVAGDGTDNCTSDNTAPAATHCGFSVAGGSVCTG